MSRYGGSVPEPRPAKPVSLSDEVHYRLLNILEGRPDASQRELAQTPSGSASVGSTTA